MAGDVTDLRVAFPPAPTPNIRRALRQSVLALVRVARGTDSLTAIENLRRELLGAQIPRSPTTISLRVWFSVLCDLASQGWRLRVDDDAVVMRVAEGLLDDPAAEKARVRNGHLIERDRSLCEEPVRRFVREMEASRLHKGRWKSIFSLMRDGDSLAAQLQASRQRSPEVLRDVVAPYLQVADSESVCEFTGLRLLDIWRYFRLTWSTVPQTVPGRRMLILVRDGAAENHPIVGIAALGSAVVQLSVRDDWIGWTPERFLELVRSAPSSELAEWLLNGIDSAIQDVYRYDLVREKLVSAKEIEHPSHELIARLRGEGQRARAAHVRYARSGKHKQAMTKPSQSDWKEQAKSFLFRSKRCLALAAALEARINLIELGLTVPSKDMLTAVAASPKGRKAITATLRAIKAKHVGIDMADITVCGAVAPYTHILGGKLVSLLLASPEIVSLYRQRYQDSPSLIASAMKGELVQRRPNLVLLGTTSLYGVASSQYNRLVIPMAALPGATADLRYQELGRTVGFGSYHFSKATTDEMNVLAQQQRDGRRVNNIFGEGVNPKLRRLRDALAVLGFQGDKLLRHGSARLVYGIPLASNFREILTERAHRPKYVFKPESDTEGTDAIASYWRQRWLARRILSDDVLNEVRKHSTVRPVQHGARVLSPDDAKGLPLFDQTPALSELPIPAGQRSSRG